jgi:hypothetical protein
MKLYTLRIGEYILTNPDLTYLHGYKTGCSGLQCTINGFYAWLANPLNLFGLGALGALGIVVILLVFAGPTVVALLLIFSRRKGAT